MADNGDFDFDARVDLRELRADVKALMASIKTLAGAVEHQHEQIAMLLQAALAQQKVTESHERRINRLEGGEERTQ